jgi:hypothetical protein
MATQTATQPTKSNIYGEIPNGSHMGFFKWGTAVYDAPVTYSYGYIVAPSKEHMDLAVLNYITKYGLREITSVTQEEYESNTQI